jgi:hypothetical protein
VQRRRAVGDESDALARGVVEREQRDAVDRAGGRAQRFRAERVGAPAGEGDRGAEGVGRAQERPDIAGVDDPPERERRLARLAGQVRAAVERDDARRVGERRDPGQQLRLDGLAGDEELDRLDSRVRGRRDEILALDGEEPELLALALLREELAGELQRRVRRRRDQGATPPCQTTCQTRARPSPARRPR